MPSFLQRMKRLAFEHLDLPLILIIAPLMAIGLSTVYSATYDANNRVFGQLINLSIGIVLMWAVARVHPQHLMRLAPPLYLFGVVLLILVFFIGIRVNGARRWLSFGFVRCQPSEILKIATPMMLAWYFQKYETAIKIRHYSAAFLMLFLPFALIAKQPDLGTAILVGAAGFYVIFFAGLSWKFIAVVLVAAAAASPFVWPLLHEFQRKRLLILLDPTIDPFGAGYHIIQSTIAIGSGGGFGKGWLQGTQTHLEFIPERHTDFIFAVFSEEHGFLGAAVLILLYFLLIARCLMITIRASTLFARLLGGAITLSLFTYVFVNIGMVSGILPVVGVPLPFMSYGGTALVTLFCSLGIMMSLQTHRMLLKK
jgi:rod shape determining protein RodA